MLARVVVWLFICLVVLLVVFFCFFWFEGLTRSLLSVSVSSVLLLFLTVFRVSH